MSIASLVVPAMSETILLLSPDKKLTKEDLPTFGFPIMATDILLFSSELFFSGKYLYISSNNHSAGLVQE